jgi:hypothetical protein
MSWPDKLGALAFLHCTKAVAHSWSFRQRVNVSLTRILDHLRRVQLGISAWPANVSRGRSRAAMRHRKTSVSAAAVMAAFWMIVFAEASSASDEGLAYDWYVCADTAARLEKANKIPQRLLAALSVTETGRPTPSGRKIRAWPWTVFADGKSLHFATKVDAIDAVRAFRRQGVRSIDVGCLQINLRYHPRAFTSVEEAFEPDANIGYGAMFLMSLRKRHNSWRTAIEHYHSQNPEFGHRYRQTVYDRWDLMRARAGRELSKNAIGEIPNGAPDSMITARPVSGSDAPISGKRFARSAWTLSKEADAIFAEPIALNVTKALSKLPKPEEVVSARVMISLSAAPSQTASQRKRSRIFASSSVGAGYPVAAGAGVTRGAALP